MATSVGVRGEGAEITDVGREHRAPGLCGGHDHGVHR